MTGIIEVVPVKVATFKAVRWYGDDENTIPLVETLAEQYGWKVNGVLPVTVRGRRRYALTVTGRNRKQYRALKGDWIIALGQNGSIRICSDKQFRQDYKETGQ